MPGSGWILNIWLWVCATVKHKIKSNIGGLYTSVTSRRCDSTRGTELGKIIYSKMFRFYTAKTSSIHFHFLYLFAELSFSVEWWSVTIIWSCDIFKGTLLRQNSHFASPVCSSRHYFSSKMSLIVTFTFSHFLIIEPSALFC